MIGKDRSSGEESDMDSGSDLGDTVLSDTLPSRPSRAVAPAAVTPPHLSDGPADGPPAAPPGIVGRILRLSVFYKVLLANSLIVLVGAVAGTAITLRVANNGRTLTAMNLPLAAGFAIVGLAVTLALNALVLRVALAPLARLQEVARRVQRGDLSVRAHLSPLADAEVARLAATLNAILDDAQRYEEQMRGLSARVIHAQEEERQRIARELHDDTGQVLTLLLIRLKLLEEQPGAETLREQIAELRGLIAGAIDQVRQLALNLRPPSLDQLGLVPSLRQLVTTYSANTGIPVRLEVPREPVRLSPERTIAVYRVAQEALTNAAKHAAARCVTMDVRLRAGRLEIVVRDDGRGFDIARTARRDGPAGGGPGVGLFGMEERARLAGGTLRLSSAPGRGTTVSLNVPLDGEADRDADMSADMSKDRGADVPAHDVTG
jgi:two-component system, NarL family, sensor histidine kinase UhpB